MKLSGWWLLIAILMPTEAPATTIQLTAKQLKHIHQLPEADRIKIDRLLEIDKMLIPQTGDISIPGATATLRLGREYYYLPPDQAKKVLVEGWGNPAAVAEGTLGLIFPKDLTWISDPGWGVNVSFEKTGFVSAVDKGQRDFDQVDKQLKDAEPAINEKRQQAGAASIHYVGWAQPPSYEDQNHSVIWARDLRFSGQDKDVLNYDLRQLGRYGVLSLNAISTIDNIAQVRSAMVDLGSKISFAPGSRYQDYAEGDKKTSYGIAGLIAGGVGLAVVKKVGLLGLLLVFGKKLAVIVIAAVVGAVGWVARRLGIKTKPAKIAQPSSPSSDAPPAPRP